MQSSVDGGSGSFGFSPARCTPFCFSFREPVQNKFPQRPGSKSRVTDWRQRDALCKTRFAILRRPGNIFLKQSINKLSWARNTGLGMGCWLSWWPSLLDKGPLIKRPSLQAVGQAHNESFCFLRQELFVFSFSLFYDQINVLHGFEHFVLYIQEKKSHWLQETQ